MISPVDMDLGLPVGVKGKALQLYSRPHRSSVAFGQVVYTKGVAGDTYVVGGWCNSMSVAAIPNSTRKNAPCIAYRFIKSDDSTTSWKYLNFNREWVGWQFACWPIVASVDHVKIEININYARNAQTCRFTNIFLHREQFGETFAYDDKKNVTSVANLAETKSNMKYDDYDNLISYVQPGAENTEKYTMTYGDEDDTDELKRHLLKTSTTPMGIKQKFEYDDFGNQTSAETVDDLENPTMLIKTMTEYTEDGNYPLKTYDVRGNAVTRTMRTDNYMLASVEDPAGQKVLYDYDDSLRVKEVRAEVPIITEDPDAESGSEGENEQETPKDVYYNKYTYENDRLKTVRHNTDDNEANDVVYTFDYDELGRKTTVKVGNQVLSTNVYSDDRNGILKEVHYGTDENTELPEGISHNNCKVIYEHDEFDRLTGIKYDNDTSARYTYEYGANGQAAFMKDHHLNRVHRTEYDLAERPCQATIREMNEDGSEGDLIYRTTLTYDSKNRLEAFGESLPNESHKTTYAYDKDNRTTEIQYDDADHKVNYTYDALGRVVSRAVTNGEDNTYSSSYVFMDGDATKYGAGATTPLVKEINQPLIAFAYDYDERGNIISEVRNGLTTTYAYDALGQLVSVNDPHENCIWEYTYDLGGNITQKKKFARNADGTKGVSESPITYTYGDGNWKDKLTAYNGTEISYDEIGNPTYDGTWTYVWQNGRQLKQMSKEGMLVEFKYNTAGLRVQKKVTEGTTVTTTDYTLHGKLITHQKVTTVSGNDTTTEEMHFFYDNASRPAMVQYDGLLYTYVHNLQGDIVGIVDTSDNLVVEYNYDAWGKPLTEHNSLGKLNPFRYRGYIFDKETDLYYLRSR